MQSHSSLFFQGGSSEGFRRGGDLRKGSAPQQRKGRQGDQGEQQGQKIPALLAEQVQKGRGQQHHRPHAPGVGRVQAAHIPVGVIGGDGGDDGAEQHLRQSAGGGEDHRAHRQSGKGAAGHQQGPQAVNCQAPSGEQRPIAHHPGDVKKPGAEGKQQIHQKLGDEIDADQRPQGGEGKPEALPQSQKQHRAEVDQHRHGQAEGIASGLQTAKGVVHRKTTNLFGILTIIP